jgi:DNA-binding NarL/FixJ family response regulator
MAPARIVLVDDHALVRAGLRAIVEKLADVQVVGEASDGREALAIVAEDPPDLVLMDVTMPGFNGLEATARIVARSPRTRVIIVSVHSDAASVLDAIDAGAAGYVLKDASVAELELAIRAVTKGGTFLSPLVSQHVIEEYRRRPVAPRLADSGSPPRESHGDRAQLARLTPRQREILQLVAEGASTRAMARSLNVSVKTVESHRAQLMERLGIHDVAGLVRFALRAGLIRDDVR